MRISIPAIFQVAFLALILSACKQDKSSITEESFLGEWYTIKGDLEAYSFLKDENSYIFVGMQGMRPVVYGTWKIEKKKFVITMDNGTTTGYSFIISNDTLTLNDGEEIYTRTPPLEVKYPEVRILAALARDLNDLKFTEPNPTYLKWGYLIDSTLTTREFSLSGYSISAVTTISSDNLKRISDYIKDHGYEPDTVFVSEICNGYLDDNQIITLCTSQDQEATNDSINILVTSGLIAK